ncbi:MAG: DUF4348 domain-containing protein [Cyclobacteriaceae bacterium]|nr:DUF4348 domain-containing protein [Cyclobacteriaceae bacterium]
MKRMVIMLMITLGAFALGYWTAIIKTSVDQKFDIVTKTIEAANQTNREKFDDFIYKFISDSLYQLDRVKFPLRSIRADSEEHGTIKKKDWQIVRLFGNDEYKAQLYDNFNGELRDTDERLFCWEGIENGISVQYKFKRIEGRWYLIEYNDFSD